MQRLFISHGEQMSTGEHWPEDPPLTLSGIRQSLYLGKILRDNGWDMTAVASSERLRARQTSVLLGFSAMNVIPSLNGTCKDDYGSRMELARRLYNGDVPSEVEASVERLLEDLPPQQTLVTSREIIAGLRAKQMREEGIELRGKNLLVPTLGFHVLDVNQAQPQNLFPIH